MTGYILFVDDERLVERLITSYFRHKIRQREYEFIFAENGTDALKKMQEYPQIDLLITDINMPEMDGLTLLSEIRALNLNIKTIIVSAYEDMRHMRQAMNQGAFDFIAKPINFQELEASISLALEYRQQIKNKKLLELQALLSNIQNQKELLNNQVVLGGIDENNSSVNLAYTHLQEIKNIINKLISHLQLYQQEFPNASPKILQNAKDIDLESLLKVQYDINMLTIPCWKPFGLENGGKA